MPKNAKGAIFINYRREDSNWNALALYNELQKYFSKDQIFKDFNAIQPGDDFVESIGSALQRCDVLLVLMGSKWLDIQDANGKRRLDDPDDFVRLEISKALSRNIKVIPVMLDSTRMPRPDQLPENMQALTRRQLVDVDPTRFEDDVRKLAEVIRKILQHAGYDTNPTPVVDNNGPKPVSQAQRPAPPPVNTPVESFIKPPKPDNNMVWAILTTLLCCLPLGIMSIISASKVDTLHKEGKYNEAQSAASMAKKYAMWGAIISAVFWTIYFILVGSGAINQPAFESSSY